MKRQNGRLSTQIRPLKITYGVYGNADGSVLFEMGNTKVLCSVLIQDGVPAFLRGKGQGWLTAEYTMLPAATRVRTPREIITMKRNNRSVEISRLIGRALRAVVDFTKLGERTIHIDCDVLQADGGTRTASITGAYCALYHAQAQLHLGKANPLTFLTDSLAAVSVGWVNGMPLLDIDFQEDSSVQADFNFVMTGKNELVEIQGGTEGAPLPWDAVQEMRLSAQQGVHDLLMAIEQSQVTMTALPLSKKQQSFSTAA